MSTLHPSSKPEQLYILPELLRWLVLAILIGILAGSASALLLVTLNLATDFREAHKWIIASLPVAGLIVGLFYKHYGRSVEAGNNLLLEEIHNPQAIIPLRMTPLVLFGTAMSHLFGGSAGREGTAIQMAASLADQMTKPLRLQNEDRRILLMAGIGAGFGSVFGTPLAGTIFGLEVLALGRLDYNAIFPCIIAAFVGDLVTKAWGIHHTIYQVTSVDPLNPKTLLATIAAGIAFGLTGMIFAKTTHGIAHLFKKYISWSPARPLIGGAIVAAAVFALGTTQYIGLGIPTISAAFLTRLHPWDFAAKLIFTAVTLGAGFKGGEVTPLFYIGATLGNALSYILPLSSSLLAGMGFVAVFAGAANTPIASTLMAMEMFGPEAGAFAGIACVVSYLFSGHAGIYQSQRIGTSKHRHFAHEEGLTLASVITTRLNRTSAKYNGEVLTIGSLVWGVQDLPRAIRFWSEALDYRLLREPVADWAILIPNSGSGLQLAMKLVTSDPETHQRHHLDLYTQNQTEEVARLIALGATRADWRYEPGADYVVLADPDGNRFCVINRPHDQAALISSRLL